MADAWGPHIAIAVGGDAVPTALVAAAPGLQALESLRYSPAAQSPTTEAACSPRSRPLEKLTPTTDYTKYPAERRFTSTGPAELTVIRTLPMAHLPGTGSPP